jgi:hypothetical protein
MVDLAERYKWEAERPDGEIVSSGRNLQGCIRFSLIPEVPGLPRHDFVGVVLRQRFCRAFCRTKLANRRRLSGKLFWQHGTEVVRTSEDLTAELAPGDLIGKGNAGRGWYVVQAVHSDRVVLTGHYGGVSRPEGFQGFKSVGMGRPTRFYFHCIETQDARFWVDYTTGAVRVTPKQFELYL